METESPVRVLIIDDSATDAALIAAKLRNSPIRSFEATSVSTLDAGVTRLRSGDFDVVLLDLMLPDCGELDGLKAVTEAAPDVAVVILTGVADDEVGMRAIRNGAQDYAIKQLYHHSGIIRRILYADIRSKMLSVSAS